MTQPMKHMKNNTAATTTTTTTTATLMAYPYANDGLWFLFRNSSSLKGKLGLCKPAVDGVPPKGYVLFEDGEYEALAAAAATES